MAEQSAVLVGSWAAMDDRESVLRVDGVVIVRCAAEVASLQEALRDRRRGWLLLGTGVDDATAVTLAAAGRAARPDLRLGLLGEVDDVASCRRWVRRGCSVYLVGSAGAECVRFALLAAATHEVVIVDRGHRIVDVVPAGPRARYSRSSSPTTVAVNLSEPEIREVQQVLITRGFMHGRVTGVWGPETRDALIAFQRKEGFTANGTIDTRTVGALGLSGKVKAQESSSTQGSSSTTTGHGQSGSNGQSTAGQNAPSQNQSTTGQSGGQNQPSDRRSSTPSQSTTGQGGGNSMNGGSSSSSTPSHSSSSPSTSGSSGQSNMPEKNKQN